MASSEAYQVFRRILVVAHPHDFVHMAGTCANHVQRGDAMTIISVTGGERTHNEKLYDELPKPVDQQDHRIVQQSLKAYADGRANDFPDACGRI